MWPTPKTYRFTGEPPTSEPLNNSSRGDPPLSSGIRPESIGRWLDRFPNLISIRGPEMSRFSSFGEMIKKKSKCVADLNNLSFDYGTSHRHGVN